ncbi:MULTISPECIES: hypothetical protein [unclassified Massilia]|uniref:hypothetical protein n=1 Tax=unclassified Massilia TaxID=2609279 RepID=UPI0021069A76|nr:MULTISPECIES: hypothetical protein [unclassified Massilia]UTY59960.1 hypothetical protein HPQ68_23890 [Massilia sp. erpn]
MNTLKNFEAIFVVALGLACAATYVFDAKPVVASAPARSLPAQVASVAPDMQVVVVSAKRLNAEQKKQLLQDERKPLSNSTI